MWSIEELKNSTLEGNKPIFIDYSKIGESPERRLIILKALIHVINTKENSLNYEKLGLSEEETKEFRKIIERNYLEYFDPKKHHINLFGNYKGKIICGIDFLIDDLFNLLNNQCETGPVQHREENITKNPEINTNAYVDKIFCQGIPLAEVNLFLNEIVRNYDENQRISLFNKNLLFSEIKKLVSKVKNKKMGLDSARTKIKFLTKFCELLSELTPESDHWVKLKHLIPDEFDKNLREYEELFFEITNSDGNKESILIEQIIKNHEFQLFLALTGRPENDTRNRAISKYRGKIALFNVSCLLSYRIFPNDLVLCQIFDVQHNMVKINPLKILTPQEGLKLINLGIEVHPSKEEVMFALSHQIEARSK